MAAPDADPEKMRSKIDKAIGCALKLKEVEIPSLVKGGKLVGGAEFIRWKREFAALCTTIGIDGSMMSSSCPGL